MGLQEDILLAQKIGKEVAAAGGRAYYVGGYVRDRLLGLPCKDVDLEIHGISSETLYAILEVLGEPLTMGRSFGIYGLRGYDLDISLPRDPVTWEPSPFCGIRAAASRRDFTCNAMMEDVLTGEVMDFFCGTADLKNRILRHVDSDTFGADPLRVLRAAQFAARFSFTVSEDTVSLCCSLSLQELPRERVFGELSKALLKAPKPSVFFTLLRQMDQLDLWLPELKALIGVPQPLKYHGEGDVWNHTMLVLDAASPLKQYVQDSLCFMLSALTHDFGKAVSTTVTEKGIHAYSHETAGLPLVRQFLGRLTDQKKLIKGVQNLIKLHMRPNALAAQNSSQKAYNKLLDEALEPRALLCLAAADDLGRITEIPHISRQAVFAEKLEVYEALMAMPQVTGLDLIKAGVKPGPEFSAYLQYAHRLHLSGIPRETALIQTLAYIREHP